MYCSCYSHLISTTFLYNLYIVVMYVAKKWFLPHQQDSPTSVEPKASGPTAAARRHTMAGTKPARPRPPPISPQAHESHEVPYAKRPRPPPPTVATPTATPPTNDQKSIYATVNKQKRYPPPTMPAPPPPYEGDTVTKLVAAETPTTPTPPLAIVEEKEEQKTKTHPPDEANSGAGGTNKPRPPRPAPSRPSRPPAGIQLNHVHNKHVHVYEMY